MRTGMLAALTLALSFNATATAQVEFKPYASSDGRYKIVFPGAVKSDTVTTKADKTDVKVMIDSVELLGGTSFLVSYVDVPEEVAKKPAAMRLDKVRDANKGPDGKVLEEKELTLGLEKFPASDVLIEKSGVYLRNRIVIAGNRLYQVMVTGSKETVTSPSADRFLASFEVTK